MRKRPKYGKEIKNKTFPNLLNQKFIVNTKNKIWCTDFTYIRPANGKMRYNCTIIDLFDRSVVASVNSSHINTELAINTLLKAIKSEKPPKGLILHSNQGSKFASKIFTEFCCQNRIKQSMSKAGYPYANAPMEGFYNTFKSELIYLNSFHSEASLDQATLKYIFVWYNHIRPHTYNNDLTPFEVRCSA